jgi:hypothetical protein
MPLRPLDVRCVQRWLAVLTACALSVTGCGRAIDPNEHLADRGEITAVTAVCHGEALPDLAALKRRFDAAEPMLKSFGYTDKGMREAVLRDGGVIVEYRGRTFSSQYMARHIWPSRTERVYAYAVIPSRSAVFAESTYRGRNELYFYPWDGHESKPFVPC